MTIPVSHKRMRLNKLAEIVLRGKYCVCKKFQNHIPLNLFPTVASIKRKAIMKNNIVHYIAVYFPDVVTKLLRVAVNLVTNKG